MLVFELLAALALGFVLGRVWEIRKEMRREAQSSYRIPAPHL
jgi:hypothetical protein